MDAVGDRREHVAEPRVELAHFRRLLMWCGLACVAVPLFLALVGIPGTWLMRLEAFLLTAVAGVVTWWAATNRLPSAHVIGRESGESR